MRVAAATFHLFALLSATAWMPALAQEASPTPAAAQAAPAAQASQPQTADEAFDARVKTLEEEVVDLKEKIYRSKARLLLLQESVLGGDVSTGSRAVIVHKNEMGGSFMLESVAYALDGAPIYTQVDTEGDLGKRQEFEIFNGRIVPGQHQIAVRLVYRGNGYGVFSYLEGYKFKVQSSYTFNAEPGKLSTVRVVGFEQGGMTTDLKDRPAVRYDLESTREQPQKPASSNAPPPAASPASPETK